MRLPWFTSRGLRHYHRQHRQLGVSSEVSCRSYDDTLASMRHCFRPARTLMPTHTPALASSVSSSLKLSTVRLRLARIVATLSVMAFAACADNATKNGDSATVADGGTVIVAVPTDVKTLYPPASDNSLDNAVIHQVYDKLADIGEDLNTVGDSGYKPQLAKSWKWANDSLSIAFSIDERAKWHDGQPVRAEDVRFTFRAYTMPAGANSDYVSNIDSVSVPDSMTAVVWFKRRMPQQFFQATYYMYIMPSHLYGKIAPAAIASDSTVQKPVGSGRFRFAQHTLNQRIELLSDTANYRGRARLDRVVFSVFDGAPGATLSVFGGSSDFFEKLQQEELSQVARTPTLRTQTFSQIGYFFMTYNLSARKARGTPHPIFGDVQVRRALTMALDRDGMTRSVLDTFGLSSIGPSPRSLMPNYTQLKQLTFNRAAAQALLDSAGWVLPAGSDVRMKDGKPLEFSIVVTSTSQPRQAFARAMEGQFRGVGARATVRVLEQNVLREEVSSGDFDAYMGALNITPGLQGMLQSWGKAGIGGRNFGGYSNRNFEATVDSALSSTSPSQANQLWLRGMQIIIDDAPAIWLYEDINIGVLHKRIMTPPMRADGWFAHLADWSINPSQRIDRDRQPFGVSR
jgi:peptide/nickel transport system substrate-binding protein